MSVIHSIKQACQSQENISAVKVARKALLLLAVVLLLDLFTRMFWSTPQSRHHDDDAVLNSASRHGEALLTAQQVEALFAWSDVEAKDKTAKTATSKKVVDTKAAAQARELKQQKSREQKREAVVNAIAGDKSKQLIGDELLSLKGVFFDQKQFAVVEIENIISNKKQYFRAEANKSLSGYQLASIGKDYVVVNHGSQQIKLYMFE